MSARLGCWAVQDTTGRNGIEPKKSGSQGFKEDLGAGCSRSHLEGNSEKQMCGQRSSQPSSCYRVDKGEDLESRVPSLGQLILAHTPSHTGFVACLR